LEKLLTVKREELMTKFYEAENNIKILRDYKMIVDRDDSAEDIKINSKFFNMVSAICDDMLKRVVA